MNAPLRANARTAGRVLVDQLIAQGVNHVFCVPGESYLAALDALSDSGIQVTVCRNESGAAMMAEAYGKATGRPGICFVTRGPGATNASAGVHVAKQDSTPMILFVGQVESGFLGREAVQELDYPAVFGSMTKWTAELREPSRMSEHVGRAFAVAMAGRPGPVVLALPRDVLAAPAQCDDLPRIEAIETAPTPTDLAAFGALLSKAEQPLLVLGGARWNETARGQVAAFAERFCLPVATAYRRAPLFDQSHPNYAGDLGLHPNPELLARVKHSDLLIVLGARLNQTTSQNYTLFDNAAPERKLVHIHAGVEELGRVFRPRLAIHATPQAFAAALESLRPSNDPVWKDLAAAAHADYLAFSDEPLPQPGEVNLSRIMIWLRENLPPDAIVCNGAGNFASWIHRFYRFRRLGTHFAPISQSMGYGIPAAIALKQLHSDRAVVAIAGDGDFLMTGQEFATAIQYDLPIVCVVLDNGMYGSIRLHQERSYPGRVSGTLLVNPDFAALAQSFGGFGATVERTEEFAAAFKAAQASKRPSIIHVKYEAEGILPGQLLTAR